MSSSTGATLAGCARPRLRETRPALRAHDGSAAPDANGHTIAHELRDFPEWHRGTARYGFWAVRVECPQWLALFDAARRHVAGHVHPGYRRQPHVTIAAAGLLDDTHLPHPLRQRQLDAVRAAGEPGFELHAGPLDGFTSSPHIAVEDRSGALARLRAHLHAVCRDDPAPAYRPHLTVGLYRVAFALVDVHQHLATFEAPRPAPLRVREISFCAYATRELQGPFEVLATIPLEGE